MRSVLVGHVGGLAWLAATTTAHAAGSYLEVSYPAFTLRVDCFTIFGSQGCDWRTESGDGLSVNSNPTLLPPEVQAILEQLHALADARDDAIIQQVRGDGST